jgi:hypothetical protein
VRRAFAEVNPIERLGLDRGRVADGLQCHEADVDGALGEELLVDGSLIRGAVQERVRQRVRAPAVHIRDEGRDVGVRLTPRRHPGRVIPGLRRDERSGRRDIAALGRRAP